MTLLQFNAPTTKRGRSILRSRGQMASIGQGLAKATALAAPLPPPRGKESFFEGGKTVRGPHGELRQSQPLKINFALIKRPSDESLSTMRALLLH